MEQFSNLISWRTSLGSRLNYVASHLVDRFIYIFEGIANFQICDSGKIQKQQRTSQNSKLPWKRKNSQNKSFCFWTKKTHLLLICFSPVSTVSTAGDFVLSLRFPISFLRISRHSTMLKTAKILGKW